MSNGLELRGVCILKQGKPLIEVDRVIAPGEILTIMGPSGVGKSTLLSFITGTLAPDFAAMGRVFLDGTDITDLPPNARRVGILFQDDLLFPHMSVAQNLAFGMLPGGSRVERKMAIEKSLAEVDLEGFGDRDPATLSGGQVSRVQLMRMLLSQPKALLLDEAFSRLDAALRSQVRDLVFARAKERMLPVLMVTHDAEDAGAAGGDVIALEQYGL